MAMFPNLFPALPPGLQYNESDSPSIPPHQIKLILFMYGSTLAGIIRCQFIIQYSDIS